MHTTVGLNKREEHELYNIASPLAALTVPKIAMESEAHIRTSPE